jgi:hypothetical protein
MNDPENVLLASLFTPEEVGLLKSLIDKVVNNAEPKSDVEYSAPNVPDSNKPDPTAPPEDVPALHLEQQRAVIQYAPKDKLWLIIDHDDAWYPLLEKALPAQYFENFMERMKRLAVRDQKVIEKMAEMYVKYRVAHEYLCIAVSAFWNPQDLEEGTKFLNDNGFLQRPLMPINLRADATAARKQRLATKS